MTQVFETSGTAVPVTVIEAGPCTVLQIRTPERDGYHAVQLGFADKPRRRATRAERGHVRRLKSKVKQAEPGKEAVEVEIEVEPKRFVREFREPDASGLTEGQVLTVEHLQGVAAVDVIGTSKGKGTAGPMKRHHFHGLPASHGVKRKHRSPGSVGASADPARVFKGTRMAGRMGGVRATARNLKVVKIDSEKNLLLVRGAVPGPNGGYVLIRKTNKI
jgi:large subunit ribosomal protein L3